MSLWLVAPVQYRNPISNEYVQGVEVEIEYQGIIPDGFEMLEFPEADYLLFEVILMMMKIMDRQFWMLKVISEYDFHGNGYERDENNLNTAGTNLYAWIY